MIKDRIRNSLRYTGVMFASEVPASVVFYLSMQLICAIIGKYDFYAGEAVPLMLLSSLFSIACAVALRYLFIRNNFKELLSLTDQRTVDQSKTVLNYAVMIVPGEIVRFLLSALTFTPSKMFGLHFLEGAFSFAPDFYWYFTYLVPGGRETEAHLHGFTSADNLAFSKIYLVYLIAEMAVLCYAVSKLFRKYRKEQKNKLTMYSDANIHEKEILQSTFYYENKIDVFSILMCVGILIGSQLFASFLLTLMNTLLGSWVSMSGGESLYVFRILFTVPLIIIVPIIIIRKNLKYVVGKHISLADEDKKWTDKALKLLLPCEILRFVIGLLPLSGTRLGYLTSPLTYQLYVLGYSFPFEKIEENGALMPLTTVDYLVFIGIYLVYFAVYELLLFRRYKKLRDSQINRLKGDLYERRKK